MLTFFLLPNSCVLYKTDKQHNNDKISWTRYNINGTGGFTILRSEYTLREYSKSVKNLLRSKNRNDTIFGKFFKVFFSFKKLIQNQWFFQFLTFQKIDFYIFFKRILIIFPRQKPINLNQWWMKIIKINFLEQLIEKNRFRWLPSKLLNKASLFICSILD